MTGVALSIFVILVRGHFREDSETPPQEKVVVSVAPGGQTVIESSPAGAIQPPKGMLFNPPWVEDADAARPPTGTRRHEKNQSINESYPDPLDGLRKYLNKSKHVGVEHWILNRSFDRMFSTLKDRIQKMFERRNKTEDF